MNFNLAENRKDPQAPFAFLATYTARLSAYGKAQHQPLSAALAEFSGGHRKAQLLSLLLPVQRAAQQCEWLHEMVEAGEIYHPLRWLPEDALRFLRDVPKLEASGVVVRMPGAWQAGRPARPRVTSVVGSTAEECPWPAADSRPLGRGGREEAGCRGGALSFHREARGKKWTDFR